MTRVLQIAVTGALGALLLAGIPRAPRLQRQPYAPTPDIPQHPGNDALLRMEIASIRLAQVPDRSDVDIPPYPNALLIRTTPGEARSDGNRLRVIRLPVLTLVTPDSIDAVLAYYERELRAWNQKRLLGGHYFWQGDQDFSPVGRVALITESVQVLEAGTVKLVPRARTEIHVRYRPPQLPVEDDPGSPGGIRPPNGSG